MNRTELESRIRKALRQSRKGPLKAKELAGALEIPTRDYRRFKELLRELQEAGTLYRVKGQRYALPEKISLKVGVLQLTRRGDGFVLAEDGGKDIFVPGSRLESAMDRDRVVVRVEAKPRGKNPEGSIIKVLSRAHPTVVGTFRGSRKFSYVDPLDDRLSKDILIPAGEEGEATPGDIVVVRITAYGDRKLSPLGEVERVLGRPEEPGVDVLSILFSYGLELEFSPEVEAEAQAQVEKARKEGLGDRTDRSALHVFTIDPADARDHDDALSVEPAGEGLWEVGIHIADVSYFVERNGLLDQEAYRRGTSVYLVDRVVPMLPHALSSDLCSLRPGEDRAALSLFVTLDKTGRRQKHRMERTLIRSRHKLSYEEVQSVLEGKGSIDPRTDGDLAGLAKLADALRSQRAQRGSLDFDLPEARVLLDPKGAPVDIQKVVQLESHRLIESFMLLANETVAQEMAERHHPIPYRIHEPPSPDRLRELRRFLATLGYPLPRKGSRAKDLQKVLTQVEGKPEASLVSTVILRSMAKARYHPENVGHFGLGAERYTHFTSPIRRYPDLLVHRVVAQTLVRKDPVPRSWGEEALARACEHSSRMEEQASEAERDSVALKKAEFMEQHLGETFSGTVSGVTAFGVFVLLDEFFVDGLVHVNSLLDDYYVLREAEYALVGEKTGRRFRVGDPLQVQVSRVDRLERQIDFVVVGGSG